jgi:hypothetical protein
MVVRPASAADRNRVIELLSNVFGGRNLPFISPEMMAWKYDVLRRGWAGPPGWVAEKDGEIAAHVGAMPLRVATDGGALECVHLIDWASDPSKRGGGMLVYTTGLNASPSAVVFGGSAAAKPLLPKMGFREEGEVRIYARPLRPFRQFTHRPKRGARELALIGRNLWWASAGPGDAEGWAAAASRPAELRFPDPTNGGTWDAFSRDAELYEYVMSCPGLRAEALALEGPDGARGVGLIARVGRQARIVDLQLNRDGEAAWACAYRCCESAARRWDDVDEVVASVSTRAGRAALESLRFHHRGTKPVFLRGEYAGKKMRELRVEMIDSDAYFLSHPAEPYLT